MKNIFGINDQNNLIRDTVNPYISRIKTSPSLNIMASSEMIAMRGQWKSKLNFKRLIVEIGVHNGSFILNASQQDKDTLFVGLDITYKRVFTTAQKAKQLDQDNIRILLSDARHLDKIFENKEIDGICVFFPDPWPKTKHLKNRLIQDSFCGSIHELLAPNGFFWFKSDSLDYYKQAYLACKQTNFEMLGSHNRPLLRTSIHTHFESKFMNIAQLTYEFHCLKHRA